MLFRSVRSKLFTPRINGEVRKLFVNLHLHPPKWGRTPTVKWMKGMLADRVGESGGLAALLEGDAEQVRAFRASMRAAFEAEFNGLADVLVKPAFVEVKMRMAPREEEA